MPPPFCVARAGCFDLIPLGVRAPENPEISATRLDFARTLRVEQVATPTGTESKAILAYFAMDQLVSIQNEAFQNIANRLSVDAGGSVDRARNML